MIGAVTLSCDGGEMERGCFWNVLSALDRRHTAIQSIKVFIQNMPFRTKTNTLCWGGSHVWGGVEVYRTAGTDLLQVKGQTMEQIASSVL